jgi:hypothetical protein
VLDGLDSVYVERLESPHTLRIFARVGMRLPATTTSTGKVLLAALPPEELDARLASWIPERPTRHSIADPATLRRRPREIADRGWADNREESRLGVVSVGRARPRRRRRGGGGGERRGPGRPGSRRDPAPRHDPRHRHRRGDHAATGRCRSRLTKATRPSSATIPAKTTPAVTSPNAADATPSPITGSEMPT